ncbi:hypothetical protein B566_EDAN017305 [Ephemera danica]|nr:hypothetical protein B566_EDAN017305 [Ephemera danica]
MKISQICCEATNIKYYCLHAMVDNDAAKAAAMRITTKVEREFLRVVIKGIVTSAEGHISEIACLNFSNSLTECKLSKKDASVLLASLANKKWLEMVRGQVYLGPRTMTELQKYLAEQYEDHFERCKLCKDLTLLGEKCPAGCGVKIHSSCLETFYANGASQKCVGCKQPWPFKPRPEIPPPPETCSGSSSDNDEEMSDD